jgi:uncharacterized protein YdeI (YjbR/CyaY-like superfamily)
MNPRLFATAEAWETWLRDNHDRASGIWLKIAKKGVATSVSYAEALDVALCWGWIDARKDKLDARFWLQRFSPRTKTSRWSKVNREHVARLIKAGRMQKAGLAAIDAAKADGRWAKAYDSPSRATVPPDLESALAERPKAREFFGKLDSRNRYAILYRLQEAKKPETRARRLETFVAMLARGEVIHPRSPK